MYRISFGASSCQLTHDASTYMVSDLITSGTVIIVCSVVDGTLCRASNSRPDPECPRVRYLAVARLGRHNFSFVYTAHVNAA
jgi:hypothetical protein